MKILIPLLLVCAASSSHGQFGNPFQAFIQAVTPANFQLPQAFASFARLLTPGAAADRLPVTGFGFSNPPPPPGAGQDPATQTCGLAPPFCAKTRYRSLDGSCNNLQRPSWGVAQSPYARLTAFNYADGISAMPVARNGLPLPLAREISNRVFPDRGLVDPIWNLNAQQWGQIITHDMSLTAGVTQTHRERLTCCTEDGRLAQDTLSDPRCAPLIIPRNDPVHGPQGTQCMNFVRTGTTRDRGCTPPGAPAQPLSVVTSFMDMSNVYGSSVNQAAPIRAGQGGQLLTILRQGHQFPPQDPNVTITCDMAQSPNEPCYLTGDIRANQNPQLTILQIILLREHNRIVNALAQLNPHWSDETLYQEGRRISIAQFQYINYYEYLPIFLGIDNMVKNNLIYPGAIGYINDYSPNVDPSILAEHATAAFRHFHTLIRGYLQLISENRELIGAVRLSDWFNRPLLLEIGTVFADLTRGMTMQQMDFSDQFWSVEITQFLFKRNNTFGGDLRATDIQRGRDHGLGTYATARAACGLPTVNSFADLTDYISEENVQALRSLYDSPADIDLVVGGSVEKNVPGTQVGPTFLCILTEQFYRTRVGDRFFFENGAEPDIAFTPIQLESIRNGASMARLLCDNTENINFMQPKAFQQINPENKLVPCSTLPSIDLSLWQDTRGNY